MKYITISLIIFLSTYSCQPIEKIEHVVFDNTQFSRFEIFSKSIEINETFEKKISDPYIGHTLTVQPSQRIINWINENFKAIGNENKLIVQILDASLTQTEFENKDAKKFDEKINYKYELNFLLEFILYDNSSNLLVSTAIETSRTTTSGLYISLQEKENIINDLVYQSLNDLSKESNLLLLEYMGNYIL